MATLGANLRAERARRNLSGSELASKAGLDVNTISRIERDAASPRMDTVQAIADALEVPLSALLDDAAPSLRNGASENDRSGSIPPDQSNHGRHEAVPVQDEARSMRDR